MASKGYPVIASLALVFVFVFACASDQTEIESLNAERDMLANRVANLDKITSGLRDRNEALAIKTEELSTKLAGKTKTVTELEIKLSAKEAKIEELNDELDKIQATVLDRDYRALMNQFKRELDKGNLNAALLKYGHVIDNWPESPFKNEAATLLLSAIEMRTKTIELREMGSNMEGGSVVVYGLVRNISNETLNDVQVLAILKDDEKNFVNSALGAIDVNPLKKGKNSPFSIAVPLKVRDLPRWTYRVEFQQKDGADLEVKYSHKR